MRSTAQFFKVLSDEARLKMLWLLFNHEELCVCDFVAALEITQSKASRHLAYLRNVGLVEDRRDGVWMYYTLAQPGGTDKLVLADIEPAPDLYGFDEESKRLMLLSLHPGVTVDEVQANGTSLGGVFEVQVLNLPVGLGTHVHWDRRLDGRLAQALMSIQAIKGVECGIGFDGSAVGLKSVKAGDMVLVPDLAAAFLDGEIAKNFQRILAKQGIAFKLGSKVVGVERKNGALRATRS